MLSKLKISAICFLTIALGIALGVLLQSKNGQEATTALPVVTQPTNPIVLDAGNQKYDRTVRELELQNPQLNPDSPYFDKVATAEVVRRRNVYKQLGLDDSDALRRAVLEFRTAQAAVEREANDAKALASQANDMKQDQIRQQISVQEAENVRTINRRLDEAATEASRAQSRQHIPQVTLTPEPSRANGIVIGTTGEFLAPAGPNFVSTRDGTLYVRSGPNGIINTRTGQFAPIP